MKKLISVFMVLLLIVVLCGCTQPEAETPQPSDVQTPAMTVKTTPAATPEPTSAPKLQPSPTSTPVQTTQPDVSNQEGGAQTSAPTPTTDPSVTETPKPSAAEQPHKPGTVCVCPGDTLNSKIVPRICEAFGVSERDVKDVLENCRDSKLINPELRDFRRMEGIIIPGTYHIGENDTLENYVSMWIDEAEARYDALIASCSNPNNLKPYEALSLAAVVEAECLPNNKYAEVAAAFLNRLCDGGKLRSCVTTEYALGFLRPYLTRKDIKIESSYNTYYVKGVPIGPICALEDECLRVCIAESIDTSLYYFFNDYALREMLVFSSYDDFKAAAVVSRGLFDETFDIDPYEKVEEKKALFGYPQ